MDILLFNNPPSEYKPVPFWSWNDMLINDQLIKQIEEMKKQGMGAFFMHSRGGLETPYLSDEWFDKIGMCIDEARKHNMKAWLYDEDQWPSGFAGGIIPRMKDEYRAKALFLAIDFIPHEKDDIEVLKVFLAKRQYYIDVKVFPSNGDYLLTDFEEIREVPSTVDYVKEAVIYLYKWSAPLNDPRFNGACYSDLLNPEAVKAFIDCTHEKYKKKFGKDFGDSVPGIFTDEPCSLIYGGRKNVLPWTNKLPELFLNEYGYSLLDNLLLLFYNIDGYRKVRYDYRRLIDKLFIHSFTMPVYQWCEENNLIFTGHLMAEDDITFSLEWVGNIMQHYEFMHQPGIDHLTRNCGNIITHKQLQSAASQLGKIRLLGEMFACSGYDFSFEGQKWIADWHFVNGVNFINQHLAAYSLRGSRKRDYPPNLFYQQPWWEYYHIVNNYFSRISYALSQGKRLVDVLVIHPIESAFIAFSPINKAQSKKINEDFENTLNTLLNNPFDFELGDEGIIDKYGCVDGKLFCIGEASYKIVIIPPLITLRENTVDLLSKFIKNGGIAITVKHIPEYINAEYAKERICNKLTGITHAAFHNLNGIINTLLEPHVRIISKEGEPLKKVYYHNRKLDESKELIFIVNNSNSSPCFVTVVVKAKSIGTVYRLDAMKGELGELDFEYKDECININYNFLPCESLLIYLDYMESPNNNKCKIEKLNHYLMFESKWKCRPLELNSMLLDYCCYSADDNEYTDKIYFMKANLLVNKNKNEFYLRYYFNNDGWDGREGYFVIEKPENYCITFNGNAVKSSPCGCWKDDSFKLIKIEYPVLKGQNLIQLSAKWSDKLEIEPIYVVGDFKVEHKMYREFTIKSTDSTKCTENLVDSGYPFYTGKVVVLNELYIESKDNHRYYVSIDKMNATVAEIFVNGISAGVIVWKPYEIEITQLISIGINIIEIKLTNSLHNLIGPHHDARGEVTPWTGPENFHDIENWSDTYFLHPFGIEGARIRVESEYENK